MKSLKNRGTRKKSTILIIGVSLFAIVLILFLNKEKMNHADYLLSINGVEVVEDEFRLFLQDQKASVSSYFYNEYGVEDSTDFWETSVEGSVPIEVARDQTISELVRLKIEQEMAVEYDVLESSTFENIVEKMNEEESIYGADNLTLLQEYTLYHSKIVIDTVNKFKEKFNEVQEEEVKEYYLHHQNTLFKEEDHVETVQVEISQTEESDELLAQIQLDLQDNHTTSALKEKYQDFDFIKIEDKIYTSDLGKDEETSELEMKFKNEISNMQIDEVSEVISFGNRNFIIKVVDKEEGSFQDYEEVKEAITHVIIEDYFEKEVMDRIDQAKISLNNKAIEAIKMK